MAKLLWTLPLVVTGQIAVPPGGPTWTTQSPMIPSFEWFVFDHGESNRTSPGLAVAGGAVFLSGITGHEDPHFQNWFQFEGHDHDHEEEEDHDDEEGGDLFLVKVAVNGTPAALWTYGNAATVAGLVGSDESLAMFGSYIGDDIFGFTNVTTPPTGFVAKVNAMDGGVAWATALMTGVSGATFDSMGNLAVVGTKCSVTCAAVPTSKFGISILRWTYFYFLTVCVVRSRSCDHSCQDKKNLEIFWIFFYIFLFYFLIFWFSGFRIF